MLSFYASQFDSVELNNTFYRLPPASAVAEWRRSTPKDFCFAAKGSRFITHNKNTMELASHLIGVTMGEPGVSRLVAVDVDEAVRMAAVG